jgi:hypothetical protein
VSRGEGGGEGLERGIYGRYGAAKTAALAVGAAQSAGACSAGGARAGGAQARARAVQWVRGPRAGGGAGAGRAQTQRRRRCRRRCAPLPAALQPLAPEPPAEPQAPPLAGRPKGPTSPARAPTPCSPWPRPNVRAGRLNRRGVQKRDITHRCCVDGKGWRRPSEGTVQLTAGAARRGAARCSAAPRAARALVLSCGRARPRRGGGAAAARGCARMKQGRCGAPRGRVLKSLLGGEGLNSNGVPPQSGRRARGRRARTRRARAGRGPPGSQGPAPPGGNCAAPGRGGGGFCCCCGWGGVGRRARNGGRTDRAGCGMAAPRRWLGRRQAGIPYGGFCRGGHGGRGTRRGHPAGAETRCARAAPGARAQGVLLRGWLWAGVVGIRMGQGRACAGALRGAECWGMGGAQLQKERVKGAGRAAHRPARGRGAARPGRGQAQRAPWPRGAAAPALGRGRTEGTTQQGSGDMGLPVDTKWGAAPPAKAAPAASGRQRGAWGRTARGARRRRRASPRRRGAARAHGFQAARQRRRGPAGGRAARKAESSARRRGRGHGGGAARARGVQRGGGMDRGVACRGFSKAGARAGRGPAPRGRAGARGAAPQPTAKARHARSGAERAPAREAHAMPL